MTAFPELVPAWDPGANPVKLRCPNRKTFGWWYPDGTLELICDQKGCRKANHQARHLINPATGTDVTIHVPDHQAKRYQGRAFPSPVPLHETPRELRGRGETGHAIVRADPARD